jgi:hypothetical protein
MHSGIKPPLAGFLIATVLALAPVTASQAQEKTGHVRMLVQDSPLAGFRHGAADEVWAQLRKGDDLTLVREAGNAFDKNAVRVEWQGHKLGYIPRRENAAIAWALDRGEALHARISKAEWHPNPARRVAFQVFVE